MYRRMNSLYALIAFLLMFLVIPALTFGAESSFGSRFYFGASFLSAHTWSRDDCLGDGYSLHFSYEKDINKWLDGGLGYIYSDYDRIDNRDRSKRHISAHTGWIYLQPYYRFGRFKLGFQLGEGFNFAEINDDLATVAGPTLSYRASDDWEFRLKFLMLWTEKHIYRMPTGETGYSFGNDR